MSDTNTNRTPPTGTATWGDTGQPNSMPVTDQQAVDAVLDAVRNGRTVTINRRWSK